MRRRRSQHQARPYMNMRLALLPLGIATCQLVGCAGPSSQFRHPNTKSAASNPQGRRLSKSEVDRRPWQRRRRRILRRRMEWWILRFLCHLVGMFWKLATRATLPSPFYSRVSPHRESTTVSAAEAFGLLPWESCAGHHYRLEGREIPADGRSCCVTRQRIHPPRQAP